MGTKYSWTVSEIPIYESESLEQVLHVRPSAKANKIIWKQFCPHCPGKKDDPAEAGSEKNGKRINLICNNELEGPDRKITS